MLEYSKLLLTLKVVLDSCTLFFFFSNDYLKLYCFWYCLWYLFFIFGSLMMCSPFHHSCHQYFLDSFFNLTLGSFLVVWQHQKQSVQFSSETVPELLVIFFFLFSSIQKCSRAENVCFILQLVSSFEWHKQVMKTR